MPTQKIGDVELDERELAQIGKSAYELLKPAARLHDVPHVATTITEQEAVDHDFAEMSHMIIAAYLARATTLKDAAEAQKREDAKMTDDKEKVDAIEIPPTEEGGPVVTPFEVEEEEAEPAEEEEAEEEAKA